MKNHELTDFIYAANSATSNNQLCSLFGGFIENFGFDKFIFSDLSHYSIKDKNRNFGVIQNYPDDWMQHYLDKNYPLLDPVYLKACSSILPFSWQGAIDEYGSKKSIQVMNEAKECGLVNGVGLSIHLPGGRKYGVGLASSIEDINTNKDSMSVLQSAAHQLAIAFIHINKLFQEEPVQALSSKEKEVLHWITEDKTRHEVGLIMTLSTSAVKRHCENIFTKLGVSTMPAAVAKAIRTGQLN